MAEQDIRIRKTSMNEVRVVSVHVTVQVLMVDTEVHMVESCAVVEVDGWSCPCPYNA